MAHMAEQNNVIFNNKELRNAQQLTQWIPFNTLLWAKAESQEIEQRTKQALGAEEEERELME